MNAGSLNVVVPLRIKQDALRCTRSSRVLLFAFVLAALNWFDLWMTVRAFHAGALYEANPVALMVLGSYGAVGLSVFKAAVVSLSMFAFTVGRNLALTEYGCIGANCVYIAVAYLWINYPIDFM
ncbi:MAG: hypothetical protein HKN47_19385 [Pirellulaceae bacterium]|nr:hypothetical protein [Pirellulaceae bacterium]